MLYLIACSRETDPLSAFQNGDYETSFRIWKHRAENADSAAWNYLGIHYHLGLGVEQDIEKALSWYRQAATAGNPEAQRNLGMLYESGILGNRDFEKAYVWLYASYKQGNKNAAKGLDAIAGQLSPNRVQLLKQEALQYVVDDIIDPENDDY